VVQITVDQLRGDLLPRYHDRFGADGFRRLVDHGLYFTNAHYGTANTFTASGHAVLVTGADTAEHGMVANEWFDRVSGKIAYAAFDPKGGMSPANLASTTIGDELVLATPGSRAFAVAGKDRSAIIPGGHLGKAYWFSEEDGSFGTDVYYYAELPDWARAWNKRRPIEDYRRQVWRPLGDTTKYLNASNAANVYARPYANATFPHSFGKRTPAPDDFEVFIEAFVTTPFLDEITLAFAQELIVREKVGQGTATDYLSMSLSSNDYVGHAYGPSSVEYEDNLLRLDAGLGKFFAFLDTTIGRDRYVVVLSGDHGTDEIPEARHAAGYDAGRIYPQPLLERMNAALGVRFHTTDKLVAAFSPPGFYLDDAAVARLSTAEHSDPAAAASLRATIENTLADELRKAPGVAYAFTRTDLIAGRAPGTAIGKKVQRAFHPSRSGDVVIVQKQFWYLYKDAECCAAMHGSPYSYDTFVPIVFYGPGIDAAAVARDVEPASVAPTLAALLRIKAPSGNSAPVLPEVLHTAFSGAIEKN
jgi:arylsulfatase A-like enzyme